ncbi:MAG: hypothetical protein DRH30_04815 [Deltaproteobacteria bacterium]|nr:MAG: hypothetical protein DRH30_04815 [Deltaproteobacteria bacterium]
MSMLEKMGRAFAVIEKLKRLPLGERRWILQAAIRALTDARTQAMESASSGDSQVHLNGLERLRTVDVVMELLNTIEIHG